MWFTAFTERWLPDAFGFVLIGTFVVLGAGLLTGEPKATTGFGVLDAWGQGHLEPGAGLHFVDTKDWRPMESGMTIDHHVRLETNVAWENFIGITLRASRLSRDSCTG